MKKLMITSLLAVVACAAQTPDAQKTNGKLNGRYWESMPETFKVGFIQGYSEAVTSLRVLPFVGIGFAHCKLDDEGAKNVRDVLQLLFPEGIVYGEVMKGLDRLYAEPENLPLPIDSALKIVTMKFHNDRSEDIDAELRRLRILATTKVN